MPAVTTAARRIVTWRLVAALVAVGVGVASMGLVDIIIELVATADVSGFRYIPGTVCDPNEPLGLGCLLAGVGPLGALPAAVAADPREDHQPGVAPPRAADTPAGYNPPARQTGYDAVNDPAFQAQQDQHTRDHPDTRPTVPQPGLADQVANNFWGSVRTYYGRQQ